MKKFKESRTSPRQIYRTVNGLRNDLQHESTEELKVLVDQTLFQFGLKYDGDIYRQLNTGKEYPYHVWKALPTQNLTQRWLIGIWPGFDGHDYQFRIYAADTLDQIKNNEVGPLAEYEGTNSIDELISDLEDAFKYFINEDFKEFQKYTQKEWDQIVKERVLDYDTYDEYYDAGVETYYEGKTLSEVPITGNAWFREAWEDGWKDAKACDDEEARRTEAAYEEEAYWE